jgi:uncharacterized protein YqjF (DUF2071 family)
MIPFAELIAAPLRQASTLEDTGHRPWPLPDDPWVMGQTWDDLLFAHWPVEAAQVRDLVPDGLDVDVRDGSAWLGITPFEITGLRARGTFPLPLVSSFRELNVRTYVTRDGKPGIWFFSLDASSQLAVEAARRLYRLPYFPARITLERRGGRIAFECARDEGRAFSATYRAAGTVTPAQPGTLAHFLTERYCLYAAGDGDLYRAEIHHRPWPLRPAQASIDLNSMAPDGIELGGDPRFHFSARQDVVIWPLREVPGEAT